MHTISLVTEVHDHVGFMYFMEGKIPKVMIQYQTIHYQFYQECEFIYTMTSSTKKLGTLLLQATHVQWILCNVVL